MNFVLQILLLISFIFLIFLNRKTGIKLFLISILLCMFIFPSISINYAKQGFDLWVTVIVASLFPFFILNDLLISFGIPDSLAKLFSKLFNKLFKTSGYGAYVFILSIFSGYPSGAKIVSQLIKENKISKDEGQRILNFASTSGPLFIVGAVGTGMMNNTYAGYVMFFSHIIGALLNGIFLSIFYPKGNNNAFILKNKKNNSNVFYTAIINSLVTTGLIGGYIIFFSTVIGLLKQVKFFDSLYLLFSFILPEKISHIIVILLQSLIEISNGCNILANSKLTLETITILQTFIISFSGISIIMQVYTLIYDCGLSLKKYVVSKISHSILSSVVCFLLLRLDLLKTLLVFNQDTPNLNIGITIQTLLVLILLLNIFSIAKNKRTE